MESNRTVFLTAVTTAGLAASLMLAGCATQSGVGQPAGSTVTVNETADSTSRPAFESSSAAAPLAPAASQVMPALSKNHAAQALKTFTFPDGHVSFTYPAAWTVRTVLPPAGISGVEAIVADGAGNDLLSVGSGVTAGCAGGPVSRRVFDQAGVQGMTAPDGRETAFGFAVESYGSGGGVAYVMGLTDPRSLAEGADVASWCNLVPTPNGGLSTRVLFDDPAFPNRGAAKAWMATDQYAQLKALLLSLTYV